MTRLRSLRIDGHGAEKETRRPRIGSLLGIGLLLLSGCARGPAYQRPDLTTTVPATYHSLVAPETPQMIPGPSSYWWSGFNDPLLDGLVEEAIQHNHDLEAATARVLESRALLFGSKSTRWPAIEVGGTATRSKTSRSMFGGQGSFYSTQYSGVASTRYEIDLWGRLSRAEEAARASLLASEFDHRTVWLTLIADVVRTWLEIREIECQLALNEQTIENYTSNLQLVEDRYRHGLVPPLDVHLARQNLLSAQALNPQWRQQLSSAKRRLEILVGRYPAGELERNVTTTASRCSLPPELSPVPAGLPSELLERRPDILAAEMRLRAANANIGAAKAALFPRISLSGEAGFRATALADLFQENASIWSLVGNLTAPLLNRGAQVSQLHAAEARTAQAVAAYRGTVLNAFREVETALEAERLEAERRQWLQSAVAEARRSLTLAEDRYRRGLDNLLLTLDTQRRLYQAEAQLISTERSLRTARVNLILALAGSWETPTAGEPFSEPTRETNPGATP
ncbi:MAG: efflux transporter outer membrane subunit [bacterium]